MRTPPVLLLLAAACAKPVPVAAPAAPQAAAPPARPAAVTCADAGVLLRGNVDDQKAAGPAKEAAIARTCRLQQWPAEILACIGEKPQARPCLDRLTGVQKTAYDQALTAWNEAFPDESLDEGGEGREEPIADEYIDCSDAIQDVSAFAPAVTLTGDDRAYVLELRKDALLGLCEDWDYEKRSCFRDLAVAGMASNTAAIESCRGHLEASQVKAMADKLAEVDKLGGKVAALKKNAAGVECKKVVAAHYADAAWKGKVDAVKGAERARVIAESRALMTKACVGDQWPASMRACIVAGGGDACFAKTAWQAFGFPASGVFVKSGIPECDAFADTMKALDACTAMSPAQRDSIKRSWSYLSASWANAAPTRPSDTATACKNIDDSIRRAVSSSGCKI